MEGTKLPSTTSPLSPVYWWWRMRIGPEASIVRFTEGNIRIEQLRTSRPTCCRKASSVSFWTPRSLTTVDGSTLWHLNRRAVTVDGRSQARWLPSSQPTKRARCLNNSHAYLCRYDHTESVGLSSRLNTKMAVTHHGTNPARCAVLCWRVLQLQLNHVLQVRTENGRYSVISPFAPTVPLHFHCQYTRRPTFGSLVYCIPVLSFRQ